MDKYTFMLIALGILTLITQIYIIRKLTNKDKDKDE